MAIPNPKTSQTVFPFVLADISGDTLKNVSQVIGFSQMLDLGVVFVLAADRLFFFGAYAPEGQLLESNFIYVDVSNAFAFTDTSGFNQDLDIIQYLGFTPRFFAEPLYNSLRLNFGNRTGVVTSAPATNTIFASANAEELLRIYVATNTLVGSNVAIAASLQDVFDDFTFTEVVDSAASTYVRGPSQSVIKQSLAFHITNKACPPEKTYSPFVSAEAATDGFPTVPTTPPTLGTDTLKLEFPTTAPTDTLLLKNPEFDNDDIITFAKIDRRTRGGDRKIFADLDWSQTQSFRLTIRNLDENCNNVSVQDVIDFLNLTIGKQIRLTDWEAREWDGIIVAPETEMRLLKGGTEFDVIFEGVLV